MDSGDLRSIPLSMRKENLARLLARRPDGIFLSDFEQGEIRSDLFLAACQMGLEGLVSKRLYRPTRGRRSKHWIKVKNRKHPAMQRAWIHSRACRSCKFPSSSFECRLLGLANAEFVSGLGAS